MITGIELNPWEESKAYKTYKNEEADLPPNAQPNFPRDKKLIGLSMNAPNTHKLYIHYCTNCIGMMHFIHVWNKDVEVALNGNYNMNKVNLRFEKYKQTIEFLTQTIREQEKELSDVNKRNVLLENGKDWLSNWEKSHRGDLGYDVEENLSLQLSKWKNIAFMAAADKESTEYESNMR